MRQSSSMALCISPSNPIRDSGLAVETIFVRDPHSSRISIALSGKHLSFIYLSERSIIKEIISGEYLTA